MWLTRNGKLSSPYCRRRTKPVPLCGQSDKSSMVYFINSRTVVIGLTCPEISPHTQAFSGITRIGAKKVRSIASWQNCIVKCANKSKKTAMDDIDNDWLTSGEKHSFMPVLSLKGFVFTKRPMASKDIWRWISWAFPFLRTVQKLASVMTRRWLKCFHKTLRRCINAGWFNSIRVFPNTSNNEVIIELSISAYLLTLNSTMFCGVVVLNSDASGYFRLQL